MTNQPRHKLRRRIRLYIVVVIAGLFLSGVTAFPIENELAVLVNYRSALPSTMDAWLNEVYEAVKTTNGPTLF